MDSEIFLNFSFDKKVVLGRFLRYMSYKKPGYALRVINAQRIFDNPNESVPADAEVFIGKVPKNCFEDELIPYLESVSSVKQLRIMTDFKGRVRGYAFAVFASREEALKVVETLNETPIRPNVTLGISICLNNKRLFIGNIPEYCTKEDLWRELAKLVAGVTNVILYDSLEKKGRNRGYGFVEFENHRQAAIARKQLTPSNFFLWEQEVIIDWAEPLPVLTPEEMKTVSLQIF